MFPYAPYSCSHPLHAVTSWVSGTTHHPLRTLELKCEIDHAEVLYCCIATVWGVRSEMHPRSDNISRNTVSIITLKSQHFTFGGTASVSPDVSASKPRPIESRFSARPLPSITRNRAIEITPLDSSWTGRRCNHLARLRLGHPLRDVSAGTAP